MPKPSPLDRIREVAPTLPPALAAVADWLLRHAVQAATLGIEDIARASGSSAASVNRLARQAGYDGFIALKADLTRELHAVIGPVQKLRAGSDHGALEPPANHVLIAQSNLDQMVRDTSSRAVGAAVRKLIAAKRIYILGLGLTAHLSHWLSDALAPYVATVVALGQSGGTEQSAVRLLGIGRGDVLVAMSVPRYSRDTVGLARVARERGAHVIAIVDSPAAPLATAADNVLVTPSEHAFLASSWVGMQLMNEVLVSGVMRANPKATQIAADLADSVHDHLAYLPVSGT